MFNTVIDEHTCHLLIISFKSYKSIISLTIDPDKSSRFCLVFDFGLSYHILFQIPESDQEGPSDAANATKPRIRVLSN
jgi:hypothetical protein